LYNLPEVEKVAFSLDSGKTSDLISTKYGYYIIQIIDKESGHQRSLEQVKTEILEVLKKEAAERRYNEWFDGIKSKYPIEIHPENF
jgi:peptidyl-prolyl cis-trans isomerase D